jgi:hypothetical protein
MKACTSKHKLLYASSTLLLVAIVSSELAVGVDVVLA